MAQKKFKRSIKLIKPGLQLKLIGMFCAVSATSLLLQYMLFASKFSELASTLPDGGAYVMSVLPGLLIEVLTISLAFLLPVMLCVGILSTFRIAGPIYRFEQYLRQVIRNEAQEPCRIRKGDELWDLCDLINEATAPVRMGRDGDKAGASEELDELVEARIDEPLAPLSRR